MNPRIGRRSQYNKIETKPKPAAVLFVERNTKKNISMRQEFLYLEDVKVAMNIHHLEVSLNLKKRMRNMLNKSPENTQLINYLEDAIEKDRHRLQKDYKISL
ncbi:MAG: hypothetical protein R2764_00725 [Bacteroidales bacterium]